MGGHRRPIMRAMHARNQAQFVPAGVVAPMQASGHPHRSGAPQGQYVYGGVPYPSPNPYPYGYPAFPDFSSPYWFGGWGYNYPFGFGLSYPGWTAPYATPYRTGTFAPMAFGA